jgi:hypothetical protein
MDPDMNKYDLEHVVNEHPLMSKEEWAGIYDRAWHVYYSWEHIETLIKRAVATGIKPARLSSMIFQFYAGYLYERVHPLQTGVFRRKVRTHRRYGMPLENPFVFYPRRVAEIVWTYSRGFLFVLKLMRLRKRLQHDPEVKNYTDLAITPVDDGLTEHLEMFEVTDAARTSVAKTKARTETIRKARQKIPVEVGA